MEEVKSRRHTMTDEEVEARIAELKADPDVRLAWKEKTVKYKRQPISAPSAFLPNIGTPAMMQMTTAIKGSASRVGFFLVIINAATTRNATTIRMPCNIVLLLFLRGQAPFILTVNHGKFHFQASVLHSRL